MEVAPRQDHAPTGQSRLSVDDAANLFAKRRESAGPPREQEEASVEDLAERRRAPALDSAEDADPEVGQQPDDDETLGALSEQEDGEAGEEESAGPIALNDDQVVRLPDGTEIQVAELRRGQLREADYTQKTQVLAESRKILDDAAQRMSVQLGWLTQQATAELQQFANVDWAGLMEQDPAKFQRERLRHEQAREKFATLRAREQEILQTVQQRQQAEAGQRRKAAVQFLSKNYPGGWSQGEYQSLLAYAQQHGWPQQAVENWDDPLVFMMLRKARAFDEAQKVGRKKVVQTGPKKTLQSTRGAAQRPTAKATEQAAKDRIRQAPTRLDAVSQAAALLASRRGAGRPR